MVDLWSTGIILFALVCGYLPFDDPNTTKLYQKIIQGKFSLPDFLSKDCKAIIKGILNTDPNKRFKIKDIRNHIWFINHNQYQNQQVINNQIDKDIINFMYANKLDPNYQCEKNLLNNSHNQITTTYFLLKKKSHNIPKNKVF